MNVSKMNDTTADALFGTPAAPELGELTGLVRRIFTALDTLPLWESMPFLGKELGDESELIVFPQLDWDMPAPVWPDFDYTVPQA